MVLDMYRNGKLSEISEYCRCDVLDTYFVFLRLQVMMGRLSMEKEKELIAATRSMLQQQADKHVGYRRYLEAWTVSA
jgi:predicted PolB exonuclease-like 3'-5' exonuclease